MKSHSESGKLKSVFIKRAKDAFIDDAHISHHWEALNYLGKPEINKALSEYEAFEKVFKDNGTEIFYYPKMRLLIWILFIVEMQLLLLQKE